MKSYPALQDMDCCICGGLDCNDHYACPGCDNPYCVGCLETAEETGRTLICKECGATLGYDEATESLVDDVFLGVQLPPIP